MPVQIAFFTVENPKPFQTVTFHLPVVFHLALFTPIFSDRETAGTETACKALDRRSVLCLDDRSPELSAAVPAVTLRT